MLIRFTVENYLSFRRRAEFAMIAGRSSRLSKHLVQSKDLNILKSGVIYGANASGKTNFCRAIEFSKMVVLRGIENVYHNNHHFRLAKDANKQPTIFSYEIMVNGKYYNYGFAIQLNQNRILEEWLFETGKAKEKKIFERVRNKQGHHSIELGLKVNTAAQRRYDVYKDDFKNADSLLFLSEMNRKSTEGLPGSKEIKDVYNWFADKLTVLFPHSRFAGLNFLGNDKEMTSIFNRFLDVFQTGIDSITSKEVPLENFDIPESIKMDINKKAEQKGRLIFEVNGEAFSLKKSSTGELKITKIGLRHLDDDNEEVIFDIEDESAGTCRLFDFIPALNQLSRTKSVFIVDELDRSLHSKLTYNIFKLFHHLSEGNESQLIATTHESLLLDLELFRKDEIWFIEKENSASRLYSLDEFSVRNDKIINKDYLLGRYGAIPLFKSFKNLNIK